MSSCAYIAYRIGQHHVVVAARASSPAGIASTERTARRQKRVDSATGYCGLSPPTLFERIGIMAGDGQRFRPDSTSRTMGALRACGALAVPSLPSAPAARVRDRS